MMECETTAFNVWDRQRSGCKKKLELTNITEKPNVIKLVTSADIRTLLFTSSKPPHEPQADVFDMNDVITYSETIALAYSPHQ